MLPQTDWLGRPGVGNVDRAMADPDASWRILRTAAFVF